MILIMKLLQEIYSRFPFGYEIFMWCNTMWSNINNSMAVFRWNTADTT